MKNKKYLESEVIDIMADYYAKAISENLKKAWRMRVKKETVIHRSKIVV